MSVERIMIFDGVCDDNEKSDSLSYRISYISEFGEYDTSVGSIPNKSYIDAEEMKNLLMEYEPWDVLQSWFALEVSSSAGFVKLHMLRENYRQQATGIDR